MPDSEARTGPTFDTLRSNYIARLADYRASIRDARQALGTGRWDGALASGLHRTVHGLSGSGCSFGFPELTEAARAAERLLEAVVAGGEPAAISAAREVDTALRRLEAVIEAIVAARSPGLGN